MKPLTGIRVVDFGIITAGASTSAILADLGAEVIKIEGPSYIDPFRKWGDAGAHERWWDLSPFHKFTNRNKHGLCVDLKSERGREIVLKLASKSDIVVENFRTGVMDRLGLGVSELLKANPKIVIGSVSSQGTTGPDAKAASFGSTLEASSGMASYIRYPDGIPQISGQAFNYPDQIASMFAAGFIVSALIKAEQTGQGVHVDVSQREISAFLIGESILAAAQGAAPESMPPGGPALMQGLFPSRDDKWIAVTVETESEMNGLRRLAGADLPDRSAVEAWCSSQDAGALCAILEECGIIHSVVRTAGEMLRDDGPAGRKIAIRMDPEGHPVKGLPWLQGNAPLDVERPAPALGSDNRHVVVDILGYSEAEYDAFVREGILADEPSSS